MLSIFHKRASNTCATSAWSKSKVFPPLASKPKSSWQILTTSDNLPWSPSATTEKTWASCEIGKIESETLYSKYAMNLFQQLTTTQKNSCKVFATWTRATNFPLLQAKINANNSKFLSWSASLQLSAKFSMTCWTALRRKKWKQLSTCSHKWKESNRRSRIKTDTCKSNQNHLGRLS